MHKEIFIDDTHNDYTLFTHVKPYTDNSVLYTTSSLGRKYCRTNYYMERVNKSGYLLNYTLEGSAKMHIDGHIYNIRPGDLIYINMVPHHMIYPTCNNWRIYYIHFDGGNSDKIFREVKQKCGYVIHDFPQSQITPYIDDIYKLVAERKNAFEYDISSIIYRTLMNVMTDCKGGDNYAASPYIDGALRFISEHIAEPLSLETIATHVSLSPIYFERLFKNVVGDSVMQYVMHLRYVSACNLLTTTNLSVGEIASLTGCGDSKRLIYLFNKISKTTPLQFRLSNRDPQ